MRLAARIRAAWPFAWRALAGLIVAGWLALYGYWLKPGDRPACQVTVVTQTGSIVRTTTTRSCGLPSVSAYVYVVAVAAPLLLPDMQRIKIGGVELERRLDEIADAAQVASQAVQGDVVEGSQDAPDVLGQLFGEDS